MGNGSCKTEDFMAIGPCTVYVRVQHRQTVVDAWLRRLVVLLEHRGTDLSRNKHAAFPVWFQHRGMRIGVQNQSTCGTAWRKQTWFIWCQCLPEFYNLINDDSTCVCMCACVCVRHSPMWVFVCVSIYICICLRPSMICKGKPK